MKQGISIKLDVSKLDKSRFFKGKKGTYCDLTLFIDPANPSEFGDHGPVSQSQTTEEREAGVKMPFVGNAKEFWRESGSIGAQNAGGVAPPEQELIDDDIPF